MRKVLLFLSSLVMVGALVLPSTAEENPIVAASGLHKLIEARVKTLDPGKSFPGPSAEDAGSLASAKYMMRQIDEANYILNGCRTNYENDPLLALPNPFKKTKADRDVEKLVDKLPEWKFDILPTDKFSFNIGATGNFCIDWGDDEGAQRVTSGVITKEYKTAAPRTVKIKGKASGYTRSGYSAAAISFANNLYLSKIYGGLGRVFPTVEDGAQPGMQPNFVGAFRECKELRGEIPPDLFDGVHGRPVDAMFQRTFSGSSGLSGSIPADLFAGISGVPESFMFNGTFFGCTGLTGEIPGGLFSGISGAPASDMFNATFYGCTGLTGQIPGNLFGSIRGDFKSWMFGHTFFGCSGLSGPIPENLFGGSNLSGKPEYYMFAHTFEGCSGLTGSIPQNLFGASNIKGTPARGMFSKTFSGCSGLTGSIPENLFGGTSLNGAPVDTMFYDTFEKCSGLTGSIPENLFGGINIGGAPAEMMFCGTFHGCSGLTGSIPENLFGGTNLKGAPASSMFSGTFSGCSGLTSQAVGPNNPNGYFVPENLFGGRELGGNATSLMFHSTFRNCSGLTGSIPPDLFGGTNVNSISSDKVLWGFGDTFMGCVGLTGNIPSGLFGRYSGPAGQVFNGTFYDCSGLTGIEDGIWDLSGMENTHVSDMFSGTFYGCRGITSESPSIAPGSDVKLWEHFTNYDPKPRANYADRDRPFRATKLADYAEIPTGWK